MRLTEAAALLAVAAAFDNRKPDTDAAQAWGMALDGMRFEDCREVIVAHYRTSTEWLMPSHVITGVRRIRDARLLFAGDPTPPPDLTPSETIAWLGDARRRIADGEHIEDPYDELTERQMPAFDRVFPSPVDHSANADQARRMLHPRRDLGDVSESEADDA